jgi:hypothetical protein
VERTAGAIGSAGQLQSNARDETNNSPTNLELGGPGLRLWRRQRHVIRRWRKRGVELGVESAKDPALARGRGQGLHSEDGRVRMRGVVGPCVGGGGTPS